ncbi:unnamed protein product [Brassica oleracea]
MRTLVVDRSTRHGFVLLMPGSLMVTGVLGVLDVTLANDVYVYVSCTFLCCPSMVQSSAAAATSALISCFRSYKKNTSSLFG